MTTSYCCLVYRSSYDKRLSFVHGNYVQCFLREEEKIVVKRKIMGG